MQERPTGTLVLVHVPAPDGTDRIVGFEVLDSN